MFPRVLHIGAQPIGIASNTGVTLATMFGSWPSHALMQVCLEGTATNSPFPVVVAPSSTSPVDTLVRAAMTSRLRGRVAPRRGSPRPTDGMNNSIARTTTQSSRDRARSHLAALCDIGPIVLPPSLRNSTADFQPAVIHSALGGVRVMKLVLALSRHLNIPVVPHFMDDWPSTLFTDGQLGGFARAETARVLSQILDRSTVCLTIGDDMRVEFERRFNRPCVTVGNSVNVGDFAINRPPPRGADGRPTLRYVGGLHLGRDAALAAVAQAITSMQGSSIDWLIEIFSPESDRVRATALEQTFGCVRYCGSVAPDLVPATLMQADALLFLESNVPEVLDFTRLSVSTKVPQYLASGRPIFVFGPENQSSVRLLRSTAETTFVSSDCSNAEMMDGLVRLTNTATTSHDPAPSVLPEWFGSKFSESATQGRLHAALLNAIADSR